MGLSERPLAVTQTLLGLLPCGHVAGSPKPFGNVAVRVEQWDGPGKGPTPAPVHAPHAVLELENALRAHRSLDRGHDVRLIVGMDVLVEPGATRIFGIGEEV